MNNKIVKIGLMIAFSVALYNCVDLSSYSLSAQKMCGKTIYPIEIKRYMPKKYCKRTSARKENILSEPEKAKQDFRKKLSQIGYSDRKEWFIKYKSIISEFEIYSDYIGIPDSIYQHFDLNHIDILRRLVAAEATGGDFESKCNVASVVWNRIGSKDYPDDIPGVIYEKDGSVQFTPTYDGRINIVEVTEDDILAVEYTYMFGSTVYDCIAFDNTKGMSWNKRNLEAVFTDSINHTFYRKR